MKDNKKVKTEVNVNVLLNGLLLKIRTTSKRDRFVAFLIVFVLLIPVLLPSLANKSIDLSRKILKEILFFMTNSSSPSNMQDLVMFVVIILIVIFSLIGLISSYTKFAIRHKKIELHKSRQEYVEMLNSGKLRVSIGYPARISKRYTSQIVVYIFLDKMQAIVIQDMWKILGADSEKRFYETNLGFGLKVKIKIACSGIDFSGDVSKDLIFPINKTFFIAKPKDDCYPGYQTALLSIVDYDTDIEYFSTTFEIDVADFAFDHISRPLLSRVSAIVLGIGSFVMFFLTLLEQIDKTVGMTSGTAVGIIAVIVYTNFYNLYQRIRPNIP